DYVGSKKPEDAIEAIESDYSEQVTLFIRGKGSNCLFDNRGFDGLVLHNKIDVCEFSEDSAYAGAGYGFSLLGVQTARRALSGLEFASGIPGTFGGAVFVNAGPNGQVRKDALGAAPFVGVGGKDAVM